MEKLLKEKVENNEISYEEFVIEFNKIPDVTITDLFECVSEELAEELDTNDFVIVRDYIDTIMSNIEERFETNSYTGYEYQPKEDGGVFTHSFTLTNPDLGILQGFMNIETCGSIRIDFRPEASVYVEIVFVNQDKSEWLLGENKYLYFEVNEDGSLEEPTLETM